jgi:hypothetical protein
MRGEIMKWFSTVPLVLRDLTIEEGDAPSPSEEELVAAYLIDETGTDNQQGQSGSTNKRRQPRRAGPSEIDLTYQESHVPLAYPPVELDL